MNKLLRFLVAVIAISSFLAACNQRGIDKGLFGKSLTYPMLKPGEKFDDMAITTGAEHAFPLRAFCSPAKENEHSIRVDCVEPSLCADFAIGDTFGVMDLIPQSIDWEELNWEMSVDGHPIDLEAFGIYDLVQPHLAPGPSHVGEVLDKSRVWDVVLENPTPGMHRLEGQAQSRDGAEAYTWVVNFTVATP